MNGSIFMRTSWNYTWFPDLATALSGSAFRVDRTAVTGASGPTWMENGIDEPPYMDCWKKSRHDSCSEIPFHKTPLTLDIDTLAPKDSAVVGQKTWKHHGNIMKKNGRHQQLSHLNQSKSPVFADVSHAFPISSQELDLGRWDFRWFSLFDQLVEIIRRCGKWWVSSLKGIKSIDFNQFMTWFNCSLINLWLSSKL